MIRKLQQQIANAQTTPYFAQTLATINPQSIRSIADLATLPVVRKHQLLSLQKNALPFGGMNATAKNRLRHLFCSPGPIYDLEGQGVDWWRFARALTTAGVQSGDLIHNTFSYHFTPAGFMVEGAAQKLGCPVFPAGIGQTEMQVQTIADLQPSVYIGTPSFLKIILEKADELKLSSASIRRAIVSGEALFPAQKSLFESRGIHVFQVYATADLGLIGYEDETHNGLVIDDDIIVEIVRAGGTESLPDGEVGEVVVTTLNPDYPLIRFGTGDLSMIIPQEGKTPRRLKGWMGRADQTTKVKGMFVHPEQVLAIIKRHPSIRKAQLVVSHQEDADAMTLYCETNTADELLMKQVQDSLREVTKLRGEVKWAPLGTLPNDGKIIADQRPAPV